MINRADVYPCIGFESGATSLMKDGLTPPGIIGSYVSKKWIWTAKTRDSEET